MKLNFKPVVFGLLTTISTSAFADFSCNASVKSITISANGEVNIVHSGNAASTMMLCSLREERQGVNVPTCAMWTATLKQAKKENKKLTFHYSSDTHSSCAELPAGTNAPVPTLIADTDTDG